MVLPIAENFPVQFPTGTGAPQGSVDIAVSSAQGFAYVAAVTPTTGNIDLQNFIVNIETGEFTSAPVLASQSEGAINQADKPQGIAVFDVIDSTPKVYMVGTTFGDMLSSENIIVNNGDGSSENNVGTGLSDVFILEYTPDGANFGTPKAIQIAGTGSDVAGDVAVDSNGNIYVVGRTNSDYDPDPENNPIEGGFDAFVAKFTPSQFQDIGASATALELEDAIWIETIGTSEDDEAVSVVVDDDVVYVAGNTDGDLNPTGGDNDPDNSDPSDFWVARIDQNPAGDGVDTTRVYEKETTDEEYAAGLAVSGDNLYVVGDTDGVLEGPTNAGGQDVFVANFDNLAAIDTDDPDFKQFGSDEDDFAVDIDAATSSDNGITNVIATGTTSDNFSSGDLNAGSIDVWIAELATGEIGQPALNLPTNRTGNDDPVIRDQDVTVNEDLNLADLAFTVVAGDPDGDNLSYSFTAGNVETETPNDGILPFAIDDNGRITVTDADDITFPVNLTVEVNDGTGTDDAEITINSQNDLIFEVADNTRLEGTGGSDFVGGLDIDTAGNYYIAGQTSGQFDPDEAEGTDIDNFAIRFGNTQIEGDGDGDGPQPDVPTQNVTNTLLDDIDVKANLTELELQNGEDQEFDDTQLNDGLDIIQGDSYTFTVNYVAEDEDGNFVSNPDDLTNGIGLRIHFDSTAIDIDGSGIDISDALETQEANGNLVIIRDNPIVPVSDADDDFDGDPNTDSYIPISFFAPNGDFGEVDQEMPLFDITFTTDATFSSGESPIRFSSSDTDARYEFGADDDRDILLTPNRYTYDVDGDGEVTALGDGLQIFNAIQEVNIYGDLEPDDIVDSAISLNATREFDNTADDDNAESGDQTLTNEVDIFNWLNVGLNTNPGNDTVNAFDIDGNGRAEGITDGILLVRYLFGFEGETLTQDVVGENATRSTAADIIGYIENYLPSEAA